MSPVTNIESTKQLQDQQNIKMANADIKQIIDPDNAVFITDHYDDDDDDDDNDNYNNGKNKTASIKHHRNNKKSINFINNKNSYSSNGSNGSHSSTSGDSGNCSNSTTNSNNYNEKIENISTKLPSSTSRGSPHTSINPTNNPSINLTTTQPNISIVSLDEDDTDSSTIADSDSDLDDIPSPEFILDSINSIRQNGAGGASGGEGCSGIGGEGIGYNSTNNNGIISHPNQSNGMIVISNNTSHSVSENGIVSSENHSHKPNIGSIAVQNSSDITFGNKTFYQGPVTIKQFLIEKDRWQPVNSNTSPASTPNECSTGQSGQVNNGFFGSNGNVTNNTNSDAKSPDPADQLWHKRFLLHRRSVKITIILAMILLLITTVAVTTYFLVNDDKPSRDKPPKEPGDGDDYRNELPAETSIANYLTKGSGASLRLIYRHQWLAAPPKSNLTDLELPAMFVVIAHTASEGCQSQAQCVLRVRTIQDFHMESHNWSDIGYNFLVGGDGAAYEGRGWNKEGAHTKGFNKRSICIAFLGTFNTIEPSSRMLNTTLMLLNEGVKEKKLHPEYKIFGHRQLMATLSPGDALFNIISKWEHFSNEVIVY